VDVVSRQKAVPMRVGDAQDGIGGDKLEDDRSSGMVRMGKVRGDISRHEPGVWNQLCLGLIPPPVPDLSPHMGGLPHRANLLIGMPNKKLHTTARSISPN
jgi:hypothetical protein